MGWFNLDFTALCESQVHLINMAASNDDARAALTSRILPEMTFSDGSSSSMTGPPPPMPHYLNAEGRAVKRFGVEGNAICTWHV